MSTSQNTDIKSIIKDLTIKVTKNNFSTNIALISLVVSIIALIISGYFSLETLKIQNEANIIQKKYLDVERNSEISKLVTECNAIRNGKINFNASDDEVANEVAERSEKILVTLSNLFMLTGEAHDWDQYIQSESKWALGSLIRRHKKVVCNTRSSGFKDYIFENKVNPIDKCIICRDINCVE